MWQRLTASAAAGQLSGYALLTLLQKGSGLILLPITTSYLSLAEYGVLESLILVLVFCSLLEVSAGALPKISAETPVELHGQLLASSLGLSLCLGAGLGLMVAAVLCWLPLQLFSQLTPVQIASVALTTWVMISLQPLLMWLRVQQRVLAYCVLIGVQTVIQFAGTIFALNQGYGVTGVLLTSLIAHGISLGIALILLCSSWWALPDLGVMKTTLSYQSCLILASLALFVTHGLDRLLLGQWLGAETLARYGILIKLAEVVAVAFGVVESWWGARRFRVLHEHQGSERVLQTHMNMLYFLSFLLLGALLVAPVLLRLILPEPYLAGLVWLPGIMLAIALKLITSIFDMGCYLAQKPVWLSRVNWLMAGLALLLYVALIPRFGVWGLLLALICVYGIRLVIFSVLSQRLMPLAYSRSELFTLAIPLLLAIGGQFLPLSLFAQTLIGLLALVMLGFSFIKRLQLGWRIARVSGFNH